MVFDEFKLSRRLFENPRDRYDFTIAQQKAFDEDIELINIILFSAGYKIKIPIRKINYKMTENYGHTHFYKTPLTPTGKLPKYAYVAVLCSFMSVFSDSFNGEIHYYDDGRIGKAKLNIWIDRELYIVKINMDNSEIVVKKSDKIIEG